MSIAVSTIIGDNYGSALQAYALQKTFIELGGDSYLLKLKTSNNIIRYAKKIIHSKNTCELKKNFEKIYSDYKNLEKIRKVRNFYDTKISVREYKNLNELEIGESRTKVFCCGSDQVWNPNFQPSDLLYLNFQTNNNAVFCSYAASIAVSKLSKYEINYYRENLEKFDILSIREETGKELIKEIFHNKIVRTDIDPVLLKKGEYWKQMCSNRFLKQKYILLYMLRPIPKLVDVAINYSKKFGLPVYYIGDYVISNPEVISIHDAGVEDFLDAINNAELVLTNSFHATLFSILFRKEFYSYAVSGTGSRVLSLLEKLNLEDRLLDLDNSELVFEDIKTWKFAEHKINKLRMESINHVKKIVSLSGGNL